MGGAREMPTEPISAADLQVSRLECEEIARELGIDADCVQLTSGARLQETTGQTEIQAPVQRITTSNALRDWYPTGKYLHEGKEVLRLYAVFSQVSGPRYTVCFCDQTETEITDQLFTDLMKQFSFDESFKQGPNSMEITGLPLEDPSLRKRAR